MIKESNDNTLFLTGQCNNRCLMCCQPPTIENDIEELYYRNIRIIDESPDDIQVIGLSGGEPLLLGERLFDLIDIIRSKFPTSHIHLLSNGRLFKNPSIANKLKDHAGDSLIVGIPIHSDYEKDHDIIAGVKGAYSDTMRGLYELAACDIEIELRIVINAINYKRLNQMSDFIFKNLPFVSWTAFMGMEMTGCAIDNYSTIWVEPESYAKYLEEAVLNLSSWNMESVIYNIPLCLLSEALHQYAVRSISDWKVMYADVCNRCSKKQECCGLFATSKEKYHGLKAI